MPATAARSEKASVSLIPPAVYTAGDIATLLKCSQRTVWNLADAGILPGLVQINRLVRFRAKDVDQWIAAGCPRPRGR
jgi:excisionase family DNA binding protein